jgi:hypothetical protein
MNRDVVLDDISFRQVADEMDVTIMGLQSVNAPA